MEKKRVIKESQLKRMIAEHIARYMLTEWSKTNKINENESWDIAMQDTQDYINDILSGKCDHMLDDIIANYSAEPTDAVLDYTVMDAINDRKRILQRESIARKITESVIKGFKKV